MPAAIFVLAGKFVPAAIFYASRNICASSIFVPAANFVLAGFFVAAAIFVPAANLLLAAMFLPAAIFLLAGIFVFLFCFAALRPKLTAMFVARQSAHLSTPFLGKLEEAVKPVLPMHTFAYN